MWSVREAGWGKRLGHSRLSKKTISMIEGGRKKGENVAIRPEKSRKSSDSLVRAEDISLLFVEGEGDRFSSKPT